MVETVARSAGVGVRFQGAPTLGGRGSVTVTRLSGITKCWREGWVGASRCVWHANQGACNQSKNKRQQRLPLAMELRRSADGMW